MSQVILLAYEGWLIYTGFRAQSANRRGTLLCTHYWLVQHAHTWPGLSKLYQSLLQGILVQWFCGSWLVREGDAGAAALSTAPSASAQVTDCPETGFQSYFRAYSGLFICSLEFQSASGRGILLCKRARIVQNREAVHRIVQAASTFLGGGGMCSTVLARTMSLLQFQQMEKWWPGARQTLVTISLCTSRHIWESPATCTACWIGYVSCESFSRIFMWDPHQSGVQSNSLSPVSAKHHLLWLASMY